MSKAATNREGNSQLLKKAAAGRKPLLKEAAAGKTAAGKTAAEKPLLGEPLLEPATEEVIARAVLLQSQDQIIKQTG